MIIIWLLSVRHWGSSGASELIELTCVYGQ